MATARWNGREIARSDDTVIVEGNHYFPADAVDPALLKPSSTTSICSLKGLAKYFTLVVDGKENPDAVWYYADPKPAAAQIKGRLAFWKGVVVSG
jgi:uncharacterized protein (DUF427 family)